MHLLIDVGNTRIKWLLIDGLYDENQLQSGSFENFSDFIKNINTSNISVLLAAVNQTKPLRVLLSSSNFKEIHEASSQIEQLGVRNSYTQPERMGVDRWLAMIAGFALIKGEAHTKGIIVIDAGSALTVDVVDPNGLHLGGYIVPGIEMAKRSLFTNTERIMEYKEPTGMDTLFSNKHNLGINTLQCVEYGVITQLVSLIKSVVEAYESHQLIFTGGDGEYLASFFPNVIIEKNLVLKGLWKGEVK